MAQAEKTAPDWERIEADYRAGVLSIREIAAEHGITEGAIRKRAKRDDWARDLAAKVKAKADSLVRRDEVRSAVRTEGAYSERDIVDAGAATVAHVRLTQRSDIARARKLAMMMLEELEVESDNLALFQELGEFLRSEDGAAQDRRMAAFDRIISSAGRIDSMKKLSDTLKTLVGLEREAYGIADAPEPGPGAGAKGEFVFKLIRPQADGN